MKQLRNLETGLLVDVPDNSKWVRHKNFVEVGPKELGSASPESRTPTEPPSTPTPSSTSKRKASTPTGSGRKKRRNPTG